MNREIRSRYKNVGLGFFIIGTMAAVNIGQLLFGKHQKENLVMELVMTGMYLLLICGLVLWYRANKIVIDTEKRTMQCRKFFSQEVYSYSFDEFDGYVTAFRRNKSGSYKVVYLMRNRRRVKKLSGLSYANIDELEGAIGEMVRRVMM